MRRAVQAIPIVSLIAFLISVIIAYLGAQELRQFGAEIFMVDLVAIGVLREIGVLLTAIIVAGRSGSAFAAEIGVMKLNDEVDALQAIGVESVEVLVVPRHARPDDRAAAADHHRRWRGPRGRRAAVLHCCSIFRRRNTFTRVQEAIAPTTFWVGVIKAPVFAMLIALVGTVSRHAGARFLARARAPDHGRGRAVDLPGDFRRRDLRRGVRGAGHMSADPSSRSRASSTASARRSCTTGSIWK